MNRYLLTAAGRDRTGLVAALSKILFEEGCNLEDSAMTRLQGEFAVLLILSGPPRPNQLKKKLNSLAKRMSLAIHLKPLTRRELSAPEAAANPVLITVYGGDRPGIVHRVTTRLAREKVNISDLSTHRTGGTPPGYILHLEGDAPPALDPGSLETSLRAAVAGLGVTVSVKPITAQAL